MRTYGTWLSDLLDKIETVKLVKLLNLDKNLEEP